MPKDEEPGAAAGRGAEPRGLAGSLRQRSQHPQSPDHARRRSRTRWSACCRPAASIARWRGFWKPLLFAPEQRTRDYHWLGAVGRLKAGVTPGSGARGNAWRRRQPRRAAAGLQARLERGARSAGRPAGRRQPQAVDSGRVRRGGAGAAAGVRQHREPAAGQRRVAPERDGHPRRDRRGTRPPDRAGAHREPGAVPDRRRSPGSASPI